MDERNKDMLVKIASYIEHHRLYHQNLKKLRDEKLLNFYQEYNDAVLLFEQYEKNIERYPDFAVLFRPEYASVSFDPTDFYEAEPVFHDIQKKIAESKNEKNFIYFKVSSDEHYDLKDAELSSYSIRYVLTTFFLAEKEEAFFQFLKFNISRSFYSILTTCMATLSRQTSLVIRKIRDNIYNDFDSYLQFRKSSRSEQFVKYFKQEISLIDLLEEYSNESCSN